MKGSLPGLALLAAGVVATPASASEGTVYIGAAVSGSYHDATSESDGHIEDETEQTIVINREGAHLEIRNKDIYEQDDTGLIVGGHSETSSSNTTKTTDYTVKDGKLAIVITTGGRSYKSEIPVSTPLLGPAAVRRLLRDSKATHFTYASFVPALGRVSQFTVDELGTEALTVDGASVVARKFSQSFDGGPGPSTVWVDSSGRSVQTRVDSPLGPIMAVRGKPVEREARTLGPELFGPSLAINNVRLPHPRMLASVTLELTKKPGADGGWPNLASENQRVLEQTPTRVVLQISKPRRGAKSPDAPKAVDKIPNPIVQSDDPAVIALARSIVGKERDPWRRALRLQAWMAANMRFDMGIALAPASEIVRDRHGTCLGYAILLAAMARAESIPARMRMGYVYDSGVWGGHAWDEVYIGTQWLPLDAAEYRPGIADAARIGVTSVDGEGGQIEGVGDLALLYGTIEVHTRAYGLSGHTVTVLGDDHDVTGDVYRNPWLALTVRKPQGFAFGDLDAHWPDEDVLTLTSGDNTVHILYRLASDAPLAAQVADKVSGSPQTTKWMGMPALRVVGENKAALAIRADDALWMIVAEGADAPGALDKAVANIALGRP